MRLMIIGCIAALCFTSACIYLYTNHGQLSYIIMNN